ncbi:PTS sugar transporter subunit IIA [Mesorhizobium sp. 1B3]|uniref:PTS sugar transporter subunit IIA n=1 Tax=Mesorhizobium sp. 1B3 TaxID=3243599 RepID=UPI003D98A727
MQVADFLQPGDVFVDLDVQTKLEALQLLSRRAATTLGITQQAIFEPLYAREKLGSTGIGEGAAIPHTRVAGLEKPFGLLARLVKPIDFEAIDETPVDLLFLLLVPSAGGKDHLNVLAAVARQLRSPDTLKKLRQAESVPELYAAMAAG